jgi:hypothetical protein
MPDAYNQAASQYETLAQMVAALSVDYDRLQELRELSKTPRYVAGWNMPGYLPDSEPAEFDSADDADEARSYLADEMRSAADTLYEDDTNADVAAELREAADALENLATADAGAEYGQTIAGYHYWITQDGTMLQGDDVEELAELEEAAGDANSEDEAREILDSDPLSVEVRSDWVTPGEEMTAGEFRILLCTGGPAVQIRGELDHRGEPSRAWLEYQDWGTPWTQYHDTDQATLLAYASHFLSGF